MTTHTMRAEVEVRFKPVGFEDFETAYPRLEITFDYSPPQRAFVSRGEYAPIDPPEPAEVSFVSATLIDGDGLDPSFSASNPQKIIDDWAIDYFNSDDGYERACECAEEGRYPDPDDERDKRLDRLGE